MRLTGSLIKIYRVSKRLNQMEFAKRAKISQAMLSYLENGVYRLTTDTEAKIRQAFAIDEQILTALHQAHQATMPDKREDGNYDI